MPETDAIPVSASIASTGKSIRYIGDHCYAYSGLYAAAIAPVTILDFTTGSGMIVGEFELHGFVDDDAPGSRSSATAQINFNGEGIAIIATVAYRSPMFDQLKVIIPPFTVVSVSLDAENDSPDRWGAITLTGRVYGAT